MIVEMLDLDGYLRRLNVTHAGSPSADRLFALHRAHVSTVAYENLEIQLGRPRTIDPYASAEQIIAGRGGYCYHLNGAFALLLSELGYDVSRHMGGVFNRLRAPVGANGGHMALTVRVDGAEWFADVGLGDALYEPMPLRVGSSRQGPFGYRLERSPIVEGGWRFWHAENAGSFAGMDFAPDAVATDAFEAMHQELSTSPRSPFVNVVQIGRRNAIGLDFVQGCFFRTYDGTGLHRRELTSADEWFGVIADVFEMPLPELDAADRAALWARFRASHERYVASLSNRAQQ
jgi:arylamine N-acetyltransferase